VELAREALKDLLQASTGQDHRGADTEDGGRLLQDQDLRHVQQAAAYQHRGAAPGRDVPGKEFTQKSLPEIGELVRRARPYDRAARGSQDRRRPCKDSELNHALHVLEQTLKG